MTSNTAAPEISVVVPVFNEEDNVEDLAREIETALVGRRFEMLFVDDASDDDTRARLVALKARHPSLRALAHDRNAGQSRAVRTGVAAARAPIVATLDGDGQNDPADVPRLADRLAACEGAVAMIGGRRRKRRDTLWKRFGSQFANLVRRSLLKDQAEDTGCGLKVFRRDAFLRLPYFDHMHRFLPALMLREGFEIGFEDVNHRPRRYGRSKYTNFGRLASSLTDVLGVMWLISRARAPSDIREF